MINHDPIPSVKFWTILGLDLVRG